MKFCKYLINDINFEPGAIQPCCNTHAIKVPTFPFNGGSVDMKKYAAHIENVVNNLQAGSEVCKNCPELVEIKDISEAGILFKTISINMHRFFCNCKCSYCNLWPHKDRGYGYDILPAIKSLKDQDVLAEDCFISWGGGEPSILPTFEETSAWLAKNNYPQYIPTNAIKFSPTIANILQNRQGSINVSLDSSSPAVYEKVKGVNAFYKVMENLTRYSHSASDKKQIHLKYIVFEDNNDKKEIQNFLLICKKLDIKVLQVSLNFKEVNKKAVSEKTLEATAYLYNSAIKMGIMPKEFFITPEYQERILGKYQSIYE